MTIERGVALIAAHLGVVDEKQIEDMSYPFFNAVLEELGKKLNYDAVVNYAGNSFCEKSWELIAEHNPLTGHEKKKDVFAGLTALLKNAKVQVKEKGDNGKV